MGVKVVAASTDAEDVAYKMVEEQSLTFPVAYGLTADHIEAIGAVAGIRQELTIVQPAEFVLNPDGEVVASLYATTQLGRMKPREVLQFLKGRVG